MKAATRLKLGIPFWMFLILSLVNTQLVKAIAIIVPNNMANIYGADNVAPFDIAAIYASSMRYQEMFDASQFTNVAAGGEYISQIAFRAGSLDGPFSATLQSIQFDLSTTANNSLSLTFADNVGVNNTTVFSGTWSFSSAGAVPGREGAGGPAPAVFDIVLYLTTPFFYNPANGNLVLDVRNFSGGQTAYFDDSWQNGEGVSSVWSNDVSALATTSGQSSVVGLITQFTFSATPIPEPSPLVLVIIYSTTFAAWCIRVRKYQGVYRSS